MNTSNDPEKKLVAVVDCTPTWRAMVPILIKTIDKPAAREELSRMAEIADLAKPASHLLKEAQQLLVDENFTNGHSCTCSGCEEEVAKGKELAARIEILTPGQTPREEELESALSKLWAFLEDVGTSNPGWMGKLTLKNYAGMNEAYIATERALAKRTKL